MNGFLVVKFTLLLFSIESVMANFLLSSSKFMTNFFFLLGDRTELRIAEYAKDEWCSVPAGQSSHQRYTLVET